MYGRENSFQLINNVMKCLRRLARTYRLSRREFGTLYADDIVRSVRLGSSPVRDAHYAPFIIPSSAEFAADFFLTFSVT